jgi:DNA-binding CsgD family transcriptional regulator/PAS domain-containing protein
MSIDERVLAVIQALYDTAMDETLWPGALKELTDLTDSQGASFWVLDGSEQPRLPTFSYINFDPYFIEKYLDDMVPMDPTVQYLVRHPNQPIVHDGLVITEREKDRHAYYDWHGRYSDTRFRMVGQARPAPGVQAGVALHRTRRVGRYESDDIERFSVLYGHLEKALAIGFRLGALGALQQCTTELLDRNPAAVLLLDEHKRVVYANRSAEALRSTGDGIRLSADGIVALRKQDHDRLQGLIAQVLSAVTLPGACPGGVMRVLRPSGKRPYTILVAPVSGRYPVLSVLRPAVCIMITDPDAQRPLSSQRVEAAFGLTEAEARLAVLLAGGAELRSAAAELKITYGTARARLAEIFQKTETRRQGELIKLLLTTLAVN